MTTKRGQTRNIESVKDALLRGRRSIQEELAYEVDVANNSDGYESDCLSIDEYIDDDDFFKHSSFPRKRVISAMLPITGGQHHNRKHTIREATLPKETYQYSESDLEELERNRTYFREIIDEHLLIIERD